MYLGWLVILIIVCHQSLASSVYRLRRAAGDKPDAGECCMFKWGGESGVHFYVCCNNKDDKDNSCDGKTYDSASDGDYCGTGGEDKGNGKKGKCFECGGCKKQDAVMKKCIRYTNIPGLCWAFASCFKRNCKKALNETDTCFNGVCEPGESVVNCPADCCGMVNPQCNVNASPSSGSTTCSPECCGQRDCCMGSTTEISTRETTTPPSTTNPPHSSKMTAEPKWQVID